ncbi:MAG: Release factor glutamine methyltransferase [Microgenomates bacterium 39_7]|nr:MAG: Release factor glutamine methyltransferase [Microgenomates bacterium 39_7]
MNSIKRCWTAYEKNQLLKYGISLDNLDQYGDMPVEYITGFVDFCDLQFEVNNKTLIPRVESEGLVKLGVDWIDKNVEDNGDLEVLDVGTGCGNIAISLFLSLEKIGIKANITACDISKDCIKQAKLNLERLVNDVNHSRFSFYQSDLLVDVPKKSYHLIVANLPYVPTSLLRILDPAVKYYEPNLALDGGDDGLELVRKLILEAENYLIKDGVILLEIDSRSIVNEETLGVRQDWSYEVILDEFEKQRYVILKKRQQ